VTAPIFNFANYIGPSACTSLAHITAGREILGALFCQCEGCSGGREQRGVHPRNIWLGLCTCRLEVVIVELTTEVKVDMHVVTSETLRVHTAGPRRRVLSQLHAPPTHKLRTSPEACIFTKPHPNGISTIIFILSFESTQLEQVSLIGPPFIHRRIRCRVRQMEASNLGGCL
jgi:hypothetical protein